MILVLLSSRRLRRPTNCWRWWPRCGTSRAEGARARGVCLRSPSSSRCGAWIRTSVKPSVRTPSQDYPEYEILFGVADPSDPAVEEIRRLIEEFPRAPRSGWCAVRREAANRQGGRADRTWRRRRATRLLLVNDSDIRVPPDYLRRIVGPLEDPGVGLVTCLYRGEVGPLAGALGGARDRHRFRAQRAGGAVGGRARVRAGGHAAVSRRGLAGDRRLRSAGGLPRRRLPTWPPHHGRLGRRVVLSKLVVETCLAGRTLERSLAAPGALGAHHSRVAAAAATSGCLLTNASLWALVAALAGAWWAALPLLALRMLVGLTVGVGILGSREVRRYFYLIPLRDLWGFAVWCCGLAGQHRGVARRASAPDADGKIVPDALQ